MNTISIKIIEARSEEAYAYSRRDVQAYMYWSYVRMKLEALYKKLEVLQNGV